MRLGHFSIGTNAVYPEGDNAVPRELRGRTVSSLDFDGVLTSHVLERGTWDPPTRSFAASPSGDFLRTTTRCSRNGVFAQTYSVSVENALRHLEVYRAELLTADDATIDWSASTTTTSSVCAQPSTPTGHPYRTPTRPTDSFCARPCRTGSGGNVSMTLAVGPRA